ncbi:MAG TPA: restriction endonuclease subunit S, partial [Balneolales bacterium]|nr:restriction endonuclease subunit S [Balneolales bacterium]
TIRSFPVPLPNYNDQEIIVQKIESLFAQIDQLEQKIKQDQTIDEHLQIAVLDDLQSAKTSEESKKSWKRLTGNFEQIYRKPEHIDQLKQAILNEAVRGRLVPQDPNDEPAEKLLERIKEEKRRLYEEGKIRKPKELPAIKVEDVPYKLPEGWVWSHLNDVGIINPRNKANDDIDASFVPMKLISDGFSEYHEYEIKKWKEIKSGFTHFKEGDIGLAKITPCFENGKSAIFQNLKNGFGAGTTELYIFRSINNCLLTKYVYLYLQTPRFRKDGKNRMTGTAGQQRVPKKYFEESLIPVPPFNEQRRIVNRIEELFKKCGALKERLSHSQKTDKSLLEALINNVFAHIVPLPNITTTDVHVGIIAKVIQAHEENPKYQNLLGHVKAEKISHLAESHLGIELDRNPKRLAAGPADFPHLKKVEHRARMKRWFTKKNQKIGYSYIPGDNMTEIIQTVNEKLGSKKDQVDELIKLFLPLDKVRSEVVATLYAAWNDLLADGITPSDDKIVLEASTEEHWSKEKEKIPKENFYKALDWMKEKKLVPDGRGKRTVSIRENL